MAIRAPSHQDLPSPCQRYAVPCSQGRRTSRVLLHTNKMVSHAASSPGLILSLNPTPCPALPGPPDLQVPLYNWAREPVGTAVLPGEVFNAKVRRDILHRVVRWQLAKRQQARRWPCNTQLRDNGNGMTCRLTGL